MWNHIALRAETSAGYFDYTVATYPSKGQALEDAGRLLRAGYGVAIVEFDGPNDTVIHEYPNTGRLWTGSREDWAQVLA